MTGSTEIIKWLVTHEAKPLKNSDGDKVLYFDFRFKFLSHYGHYARTMCVFDEFAVQDWIRCKLTDKEREKFELFTIPEYKE